MDEPAVCAAFSWAHGAFVAALLKAYEPDGPSLDLFSGRFSGMLVLAHLLLAGEASDSFPPSRPVPFSIAGLARDAGISRTQVRALLRAAEQVGFMEMVGEGRVRLTASLAYNVEFLTASYPIIYGESARAALAFLNGEEQAEVA